MHQEGKKILQIENICSSFQDPVEMVPGLSERIMVSTYAICKGHVDALPTCTVALLQL